MIGIFWYHRGTLISYSESASKIKIVEGFADVCVSHLSHWEEVKRENPSLIPYEYEEIPRGRIVMKRKGPQFRVYVTPEMISDEKFKKKVLLRFKLPLAWTVFVGDDHYDDPSKIEWDT